MPGKPLIDKVPVPRSRDADGQALTTFRQTCRALGRRLIEGIAQGFPDRPD